MRLTRAGASARSAGGPREGAVGCKASAIPLPGRLVAQPGTTRFVAPTAAWHSSSNRMANLDSPDDQRLFEELVRRYRAGEFSSPPSVESFEPLLPGDILPLPVPGTAEHARASRLGEAALRGGQVAALVVAGGAGTRFGGAVKALVPVLDGKTFLDFKLANVARASARSGRPLPVALMTSHLTDAA